MEKLQVGQEVWGYTGSPVTVCNTEYQEHGSVEKLPDGRFKASIGGRADGTGFQDYYATQQQAMAAAHLPLGGEILNYSKDKTVLRVKTAFDR